MAGVELPVIKEELSCRTPGRLIVSVVAGNKVLWQKEVVPEAAEHARQLAAKQLRKGQAA